jgi:hypothetical protein
MKKIFLPALFIITLALVFTGQAKADSQKYFNNAKPGLHINNGPEGKDWIKEQRKTYYKEQKNKCKCGKINGNKLGNNNGKKWDFNKRNKWSKHVNNWANNQGKWVKKEHKVR